MTPEHRNPTFNALGGIDCEINHPDFGWIPFTASPDDPEPIGAAIFAAAQAEAAPYVAPPPAPEPEPDPKLIGIEFEGVMCSATAKDQNGLAAVLMAIQLQGATFRPTRFFFENGNTLVISLENYEAFAAVWLPF
ncbi:MAG: hypothetical protein LPK02_10245, partial [Rhodobacterales bacterium]|nr:hypothetical protein [Rhodobacterales bacterium]